MIRVTNVTKQFDEVQALDEINLDIATGEFITIVGPSGCGKSTLLRIIAGLIKPTTGQTLKKGKGAFVFQDSALLPWRTVQGNVELLMELEKVNKSEREDKASLVLNKVGLTGFEKSYPHQLSGGMKMRLSLARSLVLNPEYLLLDEPFAGIDPIAIEEVKDTILKLKNSGIGIIVTDHNVREALKIVDYANIIYNGEIVKEGTPNVIIKDDFVKKIYLGENYDK